jgi:spermidine export protein MdtI
MDSWSFTLIVITAILDIVANLLLKKSDGFKDKKYGFLALVCICLAFTLLAEVARVVDLAVAYATWGAMAVLGTAISARILYDQKINKKGWLGIILVVLSIGLLKGH